MSSFNQSRHEPQPVQTSTSVKKVLVNLHKIDLWGYIQDGEQKCACEIGMSQTQVLEAVAGNSSAADEQTLLPYSLCQVCVRAERPSDRHVSLLTTCLTCASHARIQKGAEHLIMSCRCYRLYQL